MSQIEMNSTSLQNVLTKLATKISASITKISQLENDVGFVTNDELNSIIFITVEDIDAICGSTIQLASEVKF